MRGALLTPERQEKLRKARRRRLRWISMRLWASAGRAPCYYSPDPLNFAGTPFVQAWPAVFHSSTSVISIHWSSWTSATSPSSLNNLWYLSNALSPRLRISAVAKIVVTKDQRNICYMSGRSLCRPEFSQALRLDSCKIGQPPKSALR